MLIGLTVHAPRTSWSEPDVPYNCLRTHDWDGKQPWYKIETAPGVYDWTDLDWLRDKCMAEGKQFVFVVYGTPAFYATDSAPDPYGVIGGASMPSNLTAFRNFVRALMLRYPASVMPIVEPWNEPVSPFFNGTRAQIAALAKIVYEEKVGHLVPMPSFFNKTHLLDYLAQPDSRYFDAINVHWYGQSLALLQASQADYRASLTAIGIPSTTPFFHSEIGWQPNSQVAPDWPFASMTEAQIGDEWERIVRWLASTNCIGAIWYDWDGYAVDASGDLYSMGHRPGLKAGHSRLIGLIHPSAPPAASVLQQGQARLRDIPKLDRNAANLSAVMASVREALQTFRGVRGDPLDRALTPRDFSAAVRDALGIVVSGGSSGGGSSGGSGGGIIGGGTVTPDLTPPPTPTGLVLTAGISHIYISHDVPVYTQGHGHGSTVVYGAKWPTGGTEPTFAGAVTLFEFQGSFGAYPTDPATRWCIWIKWKSNDGVLSVLPAGGTNGAQATTGANVAPLLTALTNQITQAQLFSALGARIDLIDGSMVGSVNARIASEASLRVAGDSSTLATAQTYTQTWAYSKAAVDGAISTLGSTITAAYTLADSNTLTSAQGYVNTYAYSRAAVDGAISTLGSTLTANYTAADGSVYSSAVATSASAIAGLDGATHALYTLRVQASSGGRTVVGGFGLAATPGAAGGAEIEFGVRADRFYIGAPSSASGVADVVPFVVQTSDQTVNGVLVPKGVYMDAAFIKNVTAIIARLGSAWIDDAMVANMSANKLRAGSIAVGEYLQSTGYNPGVSGFRITGSGSAEFNNIVARGTIYAQAADILGTITASQINANGLSVRRPDGSILLAAVAGAPPWVVNGSTIGGGIELTTGVTSSNTVELRSLVAGDGVDLAITGTGAVSISSRSSDDSAKRLAADNASNTTGISDIASDFLLPLEANTVYRVEGTIMYRSAASTTGLTLGAKLPNLATGCLRIETNTSQTGSESRILNIPIGAAYAGVTFSGAWAATAAAPTTFSSTQDTIAVFEGIITTGSGAGSFQLGFGSEVSGSTITIRAGSSMLVERIRSATTAGGGTFGLSGAPNFAGYYSAESISFTSKPRTAVLTIRLDPLGGWTVTRSGTVTVSGVGLPTSGSWSSPTGSGAGDQWQVQFDVLAATTGNALIGNGAATYQTLSSARSIAVTAQAAPMDGVVEDVVTVAIRMREIATGAVTTLATIDLDVHAESN